MIRPPARPFLAPIRFWLLIALTLAGSLVVAGPPALAHEERVGDESLTRFEHFLFEDCSPCSKESVPIATLPVAPVDLTPWSRNPSAKTPRAYEIGVAALRSRVLGQPSRQLLALELRLSVATAPGQMYLLGSGVVDEDEVGALISDLGAILQSASTPPEAGAETVDSGLHSGSFRVGVLRVKEGSVPYMQAGDVHVFIRKSIFDVPSTLFLPVADLSKVKDAIAQAAVKMQKMREGH